MENSMTNKMKEMMISCMGNKMGEMNISKKDNQSGEYSCSSMMEFMDCCNTNSEETKDKKETSSEDENN